MFERIEQGEELQEIEALPFDWRRALLSVAVIGYTSGVVLYFALRLILGDQFWWLALLNNFAPYYFLPLPLLSLLAFILHLPRRYFLVPLIVLIGGLVWLAPRLLSTGAAAASGTTLKVITFNHWRNHPDLDAIAGWLEDEAADIVVMQQAYRRLSSMTEDDYPYFAFDGPRDSGSGRVLLSRYPIAESQSIIFAPEEDRGMQRAVIEVRGEPVIVYNVHLSQPQREEPRFSFGGLGFPFRYIAQYDESARNQQIRTLIDAVMQETEPTIVAGDFNTSDNALIYHELAAVMHDSFREAGAGLGATWPVTKVRGLPALPPLLRIDYIWYRGDFRALSAALGPSHGSDHRPVIAQLELIR